jgi:hypothetical protein
VNICNVIKNFRDSQKQDQMIQQADIADQMQGVPVEGIDENN